jgi:hypothetical protein
MAAIKSLITRDEVVNQLVKREKNWAAREPGVMVVFCIVGVGTLLHFFNLARAQVLTSTVAIGLISLFIHKKLAARKANKAVVV